MMLRKILVTSTVLLAAAGANAAQLTVNNYSMPNGDTASYEYLDESYAPSLIPGCPAISTCALSGGKGDLTDGVIATLNWNAVEPAPGPGPYVGWSVLNPTITFNFGSLQTINSVTFHLDDSNGLGGVKPPSSIDIVAGAFVQTFTVPDPVGGAPFAFTATLGTGATASSLSSTLNRQSSSGYVFLSEVTFNGSPSAIPEPSTYALMLAGLGVVGWVARRRKQSSAHG